MDTERNMDKKELAVAALRNGTVIDQIPPEALFKVARILNIESITTPVTIGNNLPSRKLGSKGIIKVADIFFPEATLNRIALVAPSARVNIIREFEVAEKFQVNLPNLIVGLVKCRNAKCITNNEPMLTRFERVHDGSETIRCIYCGQSVDPRKADIL